MAQTQTVASPKKAKGAPAKKKQKKTVVAPRPKWPCLTDEEVNTARDNLIKGRDDFSYLCAAGKGGPGQELEECMQKELGVPFAIATCGGGPALHMACMAVLEMGDEAITTPYSWGQTVSCILQAGGVPAG